MNGNRHRLSLTFMCCVVWIIHASHLSAQPEHPTGLPSLSDVVGAGRDLWGEAAMRQTNGASYEFFRDLLPPPRYVHADYRYYPLILSAPKSPAKASLISNGSGLNLRGGARSWNGKRSARPSTSAWVRMSFCLVDCANAWKSPRCETAICLSLASVTHTRHLCNRKALSRCGKKNGSVSPRSIS